MGNRQITALPWTSWNGEKRLEYLIDVLVITKAAYPKRFADVDLGEWLVSFYPDGHGVDRATVRSVQTAQWMDGVATGSGRWATQEDGR